MKALVVVIGIFTTKRGLFYRNSTTNFSKMGRIVVELLLNENILPK